MTSHTPFLDIRSFVPSETGPAAVDTFPTTSSPFLSLFESGADDDAIDAGAAEYVQFLNELYDDDFNDTLFELASEAAAAYDAQFAHEDDDDQARTGRDGERFLEQYFAPLVTESQAMLRHVAARLDGRDAATLTEAEVDTLVDGYQPSRELSPSFEEFLGGIGRLAGKALKKGVELAKKGIKTVGKLALGPLLGRLVPFVPQIIRQVVLKALARLPAPLQPIARKLAERLPFMKEVEDGRTVPGDEPAPSGIGRIQAEMDHRVASMLFAEAGVGDFDAAMDPNATADGADPIGDLDRARARFVQQLAELEEGDDLTPVVENFVTAIYPVVKLVLSAGGRPPLVAFLSKIVARLIKGVVGPQHAPALAKAIVDTGLRLLQLETSSDDQSDLAGDAVAAAVEDTVRRVSELPDYALDNPQLLEGFVLEAFERAAAAYLPPILSESVYRKRPELAEGRSLRGAWVTMPRRGRRKVCRKRLPAVQTTLSPQKVAAVESFGGTTLRDFLEETVGIAPGADVDAVVHLYEAMPGAQLTDIARLDRTTAGLGGHSASDLFHPLTPEAAGALLGEPGLGRSDDRHPSDPRDASAGQRFYYLEIPGHRPLTVPSGGRTRLRRRTRMRLVLDLPKDTITASLFLSEVRAQELAARLRQRTHVGAAVAHLRRFVARGIQLALAGKSGLLKIVHETVTPDRWSSALGALPAPVLRLLSRQLEGWILEALADHLRRQPADYISAADATPDGFTVTAVARNVPGLSQLRDALKGKSVSLASLKSVGGAPAVTVSVAPGYVHD